MDNSTPAELERAQLRLATIREDISTRLWSVNAGMSSPVFNALMDQMALLQFNSEQRVAAEYLAIDRRIGKADRRGLDAMIQPRRTPAKGVPDDSKPT